MTKQIRGGSLGLALILGATVPAALAQDPTSPSYPVYKVTDTPASIAAAPVPDATPAPPPSAPAKRSQADLEKLVAPIALYPDPLIATLLPASVYPLEIVQAARFVANTNNLANLDAQPWDDNVKAVARVPAVIQKMNDELSWTMDLGEAFLAQDKDVMDAIQNMRGKAQKAGTLRTSPQQIVVVTNTIIEKTVEQQLVFVTNTIVQIQPANPQVVYVPTYNPYTVYYPPPAYVYNPYAPLVTFGVGIAVGAIIANNCDWNHGGCYHGNVNVNVNNNYNQNNNYNRNNNYNQNNNYNRNNNYNNQNNNYNRNNLNNSGNASGGGNRPTQQTAQKWQPDQNRLSKSGAPSTANSARTMDSRGWGSGGAGPSTGNVGARPATGTAGARPSTGMPSTGNAAARPSTGTAGGSRPTAAPTTSNFQNKSGSSASRSSSGGSAFGGVSSGSSARNYSSRGASSSGSRGGYSGGGGGRGGGGGGRR